MGFGDLFRATENAQLKQQTDELQQKNSELHQKSFELHRENFELHQENEELQQRISELVDMIPKESHDLLEIKDQIELKTQELDGLIDKKNAELQIMVDEKQKKINLLAFHHKRAALEFAELSSKLEELRKQIIETDETVLLQSFGLYEPKFEFATSTQLKDKLTDLRAKQKAMIKSGKAVTGNTEWIVNSSKPQGQKMVSDTQKLLLRAFNTECDELVQKVKFNNIENSIKRMRTSREAISKLGKIMDIRITAEYLDSKIEELHLAYEYALKKQDEKEELKRIRAEQREQAKLEKEIEAARKKLEKEKAHCKNALTHLLKQNTTSMSELELKAYNEKRAALEVELGEIEKGIADVDYRAANNRAGYVYIISNIGSFGENIYKIGMTRRLDPTDRVDELGDASVPFKFDIHAMIFSDDAPALETALHHAFEDRKLNMINTRREFFNVTLDEIKEVVKQNFDKTVEFVDVAPAEQYRESLLMKKQQA